MTIRPRHNQLSSSMCQHDLALDAWSVWNNKSDKDNNGNVRRCVLERPGKEGRSRGLFGRIVAFEDNM